MATTTPPNTTQQPPVPPPMPTPSPVPNRTGPSGGNQALGALAPYKWTIVGVVLAAEELATGFALTRYAGGGAISLFLNTVSYMSEGLWNVITRDLPTTTAVVTSGYVASQLVKEKASFQPLNLSPWAKKMVPFILAFAPARWVAGKAADIMPSMADINLENAKALAAHPESLVHAVENNPMAATEFGAAIVSAGWLANKFTRAGSGLGNTLKRIAGMAVAFPFTLAAAKVALPDAVQRAVELPTTVPECWPGMVGAVTVGNLAGRAVDGVTGKPGALAPVFTLASAFYLHQPLNDISIQAGQKVLDFIYRFI